MTIFDVKDIISYEDFILFILKKSVFFRTNKNKIFEEKNLDSNSDSYNEYKNLISQMIEETVLFYKNFFLQEHQTAESISENTKCSDESEITKYECVKELINYSVFKILEHGNEHIYSKEISCSSFSNHFVEGDNYCRLLFNDFKIDYRKDSDFFVAVQ